MPNCLFIYRGTQLNGPGVTSVPDLDLGHLIDQVTPPLQPVVAPGCLAERDWAAAWVDLPAADDVDLFVVRSGSLITSRPLPFRTAVGAREAGIGSITESDAKLRRPCGRNADYFGLPRGARYLGNCAQTL